MDRLRALVSAMDVVKDPSEWVRLDGEFHFRAVLTPSCTFLPRSVFTLRQYSPSRELADGMTSARYHSEPKMAA
ncbi:hypothetical protein [Mycolicibacterium sp.]|uniref:hypothetical protein n=1 Tax=Mycolicibacterium sp. TaxID=2320850 RepID=UPI0037CB0111